MEIISSRSSIKKIQDFLKKGKVLVFPTDTIYGLLADARSEKAVKRIFKLKKREKGKPIPIFISSLKQAKQLAEIPKEQEKFLKKVWPGKVTVVLKRKKDCGLAKILFGKEKTIGLRIPDYELLNKIKIPLTGTSANISGISGSGNITKVLKQFKKEKPDIVIDAGNLKKSSPSTVIDLTKKPPKVLRRGDKSIELITQNLKQH